MCSCIHLKRRRVVNPIHYLTGRCPRGMPVAEWQSVRAPRWPMWLCCAGIWLSGSAAAVPVFRDWARGASVRRIPSSETLVVAGTVGLVCAVLLSVIPLMRRRRFKKTVHAYAYELCLDCGYDLRGLPESHKCPECGQAYTKEHLRESWRRWFASGR